MAIVARISTKSGKLLRTVALHKGSNQVVAEADAVVTILDEATGRVIDQASLVRHGDAATIALPAEFPGSGATGLLGTQGESGGVPQIASAELGHGDALGGSNMLLPLLGLVAVGGGLAAALGGKGGGNDQKDTTPPAAPTGLALAAADDSGASNSDRVTNQTSALTITGSAEANSTVTVKDGSTTLGTATADGTGKFTLDVSLAAGTHSITASAKDAAGNAGPDSTALAITVDTTAPAAPTALALAAADDTGVSSSDGITSQTSGLTITGNAEANSTVTVKDGSVTLGTAIAIAFIASAETLLSAAAVDRMHNGVRTEYNKELRAQGIGNLLCGLVGALPMTGVIVRSSANVQAGATSRASAIMHGVWILAFVALLPWILREIPMAALGGVLVVTGWRLVSLDHVRHLLRLHGPLPAAIWAATFVLVVATDLLTGVLVGLALSLLELLPHRRNLRLGVDKQVDDGVTHVRLDGAATFLSLTRLNAELESLPDHHAVRLDCEAVKGMDHTTVQTLREWVGRRRMLGREVDVIGPPRLVSSLVG